MTSKRRLEKFLGHFAKEGTACLPWAARHFRGVQRRRRRQLHVLTKVSQVDLTAGKSASHIIDAAGCQRCPELLVIKSWTSSQILDGRLFWPRPSHRLDQGTPAVFEIAYPHTVSTVTTVMGPLCIQHQQPETIPSSNAGSKASCLQSHNEKKNFTLGDHVLAGTRLCFSHVPSSRAILPHDPTLDVLRYCGRM